MSKKQDDEMISVVEASRRFGLSLNYVYTLVRTSPKIVAKKQDGRWLVDAESLANRNRVST